MKSQQNKIVISLLSISVFILTFLSLTFFDFALANGSAYEVIGQATLDGLPADGASVVLTDINSSAYLTDTVGATGSSSISGFYYFDLFGLSIAPADGDLINIDVTVGSLTASTSFVFDSAMATVTPAIVMIETPDVIAPVITLNGSSTVNIIQNSVYSDLGAIAVDDVDGDITASIIATGTVDTAIAGQYVITYDVSDNANNAATSVIRFVNVIVADVTAPEITIIDANPMEVFQYTIFTDPGATASDNIDGDVTSDIVATGIVDTATLGQYFIIYSVYDSSNNLASTTRIINVISDTIPPVITLTGLGLLDISLNSTFIDPGATAFDNVDGDISESIIATGTIDTALLGQYFLTYSVTDKASNTASTTRIINVVPDVVSPVISLIGSSTMNISLNSTFFDPGATAIDDVDGDITANIVATGTVNSAILGQYILNYSVSDTASNTASTTRNVNVVLDTVPPVITLNGSANMAIAYGGTYTENGAIWTDDVDGTGDAIVGGQSVNTYISATYFVIYNYTDSSGNPAIQVVRNVTVASKPSSGGGGGGGSYIPKDTTSPGIPTNVRISYIENQGYRLTWNNPSDSDFSGVRIVRKSGSAPLSKDDGIRVFENIGTSYIDDIALPRIYYYYYGLASYDKSGNFSNLVVLNINHQEPVEVLGVDYYVYGQYKNLYSLPSNQVEIISLAEAQIIFDNYIKNNLSSANQKLFDNVLKGKPVLSEFQKNVLANFIQSGSPTTIRLGSGERTGVVESFANAFGRLPSSISDYQEIVKISNGRWTKSQSIRNENKAKESFNLVYKRNTNTAIAYDDNALKVMAYGLRPVNRNLNSEREAIKTFENIYKHNPISTSDWDIMRAIAYSGAKR